ncbi:hypothetical protein [Nocardia sp. NPDC057668]|uniref:hypothetical protein n=1 Tax=Nocardia sp. NPDC057668 TaxID=3346202 RepID=UPI00366C4867
MFDGKKVVVVAAVAAAGLAMAGCSTKDDAGAEAGTPSAPVTTVTSVTPTPGPANESDDPGEQGGGVRIPLGDTQRVAVPADAVLDIKGKAKWEPAWVQCTVVDSAGNPVELLPPPADAEPESAAHGGTYLPFYTIAAPASAPGGGVDVTCVGVDGKLGPTDFVRVVPRGVMPAPAN